MAGRPKLGEADERSRRLHLRVSEAEYEQLSAAASTVSMPVTTFIRTVALGYQPKPVIDVEQVREVIRTRGDLNRVGGLLKLWLTERPGEGSEAANVRRTLELIEEAAEEVKLKVREL